LPLYEFQCDPCGLRFEKLYKSVSKADNAAKCPECGLPSRKLVTAANHKFAHPATQTRGALPPNTGTSDDWNYDKAIGRDAEKKWGTIEARNKVKDSIVRDEAKDGRLISRDHLVRTRGPKEGAGGYRVIGESERKEVNARRELAHEVTSSDPTPSGE